MKPITISIAKYTAILSVASLIDWWVLDLSGFNIPKNIPSTPIHIGGITIFLIVLLILIFALNEITKIRPDISIVKLTLIGALIGLFTEVAFQGIRLFTLEEDRLHYFLKGVLGMTIFDTVISFFIAFQLKTRNNNRLISFVVIFLVLFRILLYFFPSIAG